MAISSFMVPLGTRAPSFSLPSIQGDTVSIDDFVGAPALLVVFLSNHCPYVRRIESALGEAVAEYQAKEGLAAVGICSNDVENYPDDDAEHLAEQAKRAGFTFPYLIDETQEVAKAYKAACTPDFFLYDADRGLAYRGEFDGARPRNDLPSDGATLRAALYQVLGGRPVPEPHIASLGCGIKWKPGNDPV
ncbi:thioredoxin family protein [Actinomadura alba]|uniref:Thioredoxin family protein n=1 Tax=Actinomadura alba TaxID=406431 RepID=A0ABR7LK87_9ACTN|nr:thioredoxin family protein [Actinomadura alba]MBC6465176.1 thioredoxin family protein [Actinomadura alba]